VWIFYPLLYFVAFGAIVILLASAVAVIVWVAIKLRLLLIRLLGAKPGDSK
jgi:hypothetical protein